MYDIELESMPVRADNMYFAALENRTLNYLLKLLDDAAHNENGVCQDLRDTMTNIKSKFICTIGPSTSDEGKIEGLVRGGMSALRINLAHTSHPVALLVVFFRKRHFTSASLTS